MMTAESLRLGQEAFMRREWADALTLLTAADRVSPLEPVDLDRLATAAYLVGRDDDGLKILAREYGDLLARSDVPGAARCAIWLAIRLTLRGEENLAAGWTARARELLADNRDCVEQGFLLIPAGLENMDRGDVAAALAAFGTAAIIGDKFENPDLAALARIGQGESLVAADDVPRAMAILDHVMVAVTANEVSPTTAGIVYCVAIEACMAAFDLPRARAWTSALGRWCSTQPDMVPYQGQCLIHQARIMKIQGAWPNALDAARNAFARLSTPSVEPAVGAALYEEAELHRLAGNVTEAREVYLKASRWVRDPQPGFALLMLSQGQTEAAAAAIRRAVAEAGTAADRSRLLGACTEIMLAAGDIGPARAAAAELRERAEGGHSLWLRAEAAQWAAAVLIAERHFAEALAEARQSWSAWQQLDAPYDAARVRVVMALAYRGLGDEHAAASEFEAARWAFLNLGARPDAAKVDALSHRHGSESHGAERLGPLTARETQVLLLVATGKTNREIAASLFLSEKTVAHHVSNIFIKLDLTSRAAATAYAYGHGLIPGD